MYTNYRIDQDNHWQQFSTQTILISATQWSNRPCNAPTWPNYSHVVDAPGQCMSVSLILGFNLDFSSCDNLVGFGKSSHKYEKIALRLIHQLD